MPKSALARAIRAFFHGKGPDLLGLAEIGTRRLLDELAAKLPGTWRWESLEGPISGTQLHPKAPLRRRRQRTWHAGKLWPAAAERVVYAAAVGQ